MKNYNRVLNTCNNIFNIEIFRSYPLKIPFNKNISEFFNRVPYLVSFVQLRSYLCHHYIRRARPKTPPIANFLKASHYPLITLIKRLLQKNKSRENQLNWPPRRNRNKFGNGALRELISTTCTKTLFLIYYWLKHISIC